MKKISIITPSFNQGKFIKQTIDSVLSQKYQNLEYIVVDGGSTDETIDILKSYEKKIKWTSQKDKGQTHAINKGLKKASGDILCYLNSDDLLTKGSLNIVAKEFSQKNTDWLIGDYQIIDHKGKRLRKQSFIESYKRFLLKHYSPGLLKIANNFIPQPSTFWSREAFKKVGLFNQDLKYTMDYDYWLRMSKLFKPTIITKVLSKFRLHHDSKSSTERKSMLKEAQKVSQNHGSRGFTLGLHSIHSMLTLTAYKLIG